MKKSTTRRNSKLPVFHPMATKTAAVKEINTLITKGLARSKAISSVSKELKVHRTTVENWLTDPQFGGVQVTRITSQQDNHVLTTRKTLDIRSLTLNLDNGISKLTPDDIRKIAGLNRYLSNG